MQFHNIAPQVDVQGQPLVINPPFYLAGVVMRGDGRGKKIGFPTINVGVETLNIPYGVYAVLVRFKQQILKGVAHVGIIETFNIDEARVEVHLFDFQDELYDQRVELNLLKLIRHIQKFSGAEELTQQIARDVEVAQGFLRNI